MKELLKTLLILGGGGLAVWYFMRGREAQATTGTSTTTTTTTPPPTATKNLVLATSIEAGYPAGSLLNCWQWNSIYSSVRGTPGPAPEDVWPGRDPLYNMTLDEWWAGVSQHGLSGVRAWRDPAFAAWGIRC